jgi:hypothetical protein
MSALDWYARHTLKYLAFKADESGTGNIPIVSLIGISAGSIEGVEDCLVDLLERGLIKLTYRRAKDGYEYFDDQIDYSICSPKDTGPMPSLAKQLPAPAREKRPGHLANLLVPRDTPGFEAMVERSKSADAAEWCWDHPKGIRVPLMWWVGYGRSSAPAARHVASPSD